jgi:Domain of unknown function (DUF4145)
MSAMRPAIIDRNPQNNSTTVTFECPWGCETAPTAVMAVMDGGNPGWGMAQCGFCKNWVLIKVSMVHVGVQMALLRVQAGQPDYPHEVEVFPAAQPIYDEDAVPEDIRADFEEALSCQAAGFHIGGALVGRRVLQAAVRERTPDDVRQKQDEKLIKRNKAFLDLREEIRDLPDAVLSPMLKDAAEQVRLIGNDAAHADLVNPELVEHLLQFVGEILHYLYVMPAKLSASRDMQASLKAQPKP